ncbi:hypothetical protein HPP92_000760 [Vanilla planifolia]|uniref:BHLH domain-containing protein n=1 Tax=Vanilla planifolia TaxID=51239 RepID=A0A835SBD0_VANPL|nr:hypothetical protein HPP92_000760 [Vanilla planifolia]
MLQKETWNGCEERVEEDGKWVEAVHICFRPYCCREEKKEKLSQRFIALAAIIPGLKKMDKASVLGDAIKHIKDLEDKVKELEDKAVRKTVESVSTNAKPNDDSSFCGSPKSCVDQKLPTEIQLKLSDKTLLVKIHCENRKGILAEVISKVEEQRLRLTNICAVPFVGSSFLDITMAAQMEEGCLPTLKEIAAKLSSAFG